MNKRPDVDNVLVKLTCQAKYGLPITGFMNAIFQLPLVVSYIHNKIIPKQKIISQRRIMNVLKNNYCYKKR